MFIINILLFTVCIADGDVFSDTLPFRTTRRGHIIVNCHVGGSSVCFLIDTGANSTCLTTEAVKRLELKDCNESYTFNTADGKKIDGKLYILPKLTFGKYISQQLIMRAADLKGISDAENESGVKVDGVLGNDILQKANAVIDYKTHTIRFTPDWETDIKMMQGSWSATQLETDGQLNRLTRTDQIERVQLTINRNAARLNMTSIASAIVEFNIDLLIDHTPKRWVGRDLFVNGKPLLGENVGMIGLYEVSPDRLRLLVPSKYIPPDGLPQSLTASARDSGLRLFTFKRTPRRSLYWTNFPLASFGLTLVLNRPLHLNGWEFDISPDWALTGVNTERKLRFTARLDGSITFQPVRP